MKHVFAALALLTACTETDSLLSENAEPLSLREARIFTITGSQTRIALWERRRYAAVARGSRFSDPRRSRDGFAALLPVRADAKPVGSLYLVQFHTAPLQEYRAHMRTLGARSLRYFPHDALIVQMSEAVRKTLASEPYVKAIAPFNAEQRIERAILQPQLDGLREAPTGEYLVQPIEDSFAGHLAVADALQALGVELSSDTVTHFALRAKFAPERLKQVASLDSVLFVERYKAPEPDMDKVRVLSGAKELRDAAGFEGNGVRGEVMDGNVRETHTDFASRPLLLHGDKSGDAWHGTCTSGIVFGDGAGDVRGRGMLPLGQGIFASYLSLQEGGDRYAHTQALLAAPYEAVFQSNSWGSALTLDYTSISAALDKIVFDLDILILNSQSNSGSRLSRPEAWAKNVLSIGGIKHFDTIDPADDRWDRGASIGPASDGRLKPELAHVWDDTFTTSESGGYEPAFGGTSGATPITAGHAGLFFEMWAAGVFGQSNPGESVFARRPHFSTAKAMLVNTASQWPFSGEAHDLTRAHQGFGRVDLKRMYALRERMLVRDESDVLALGERKTYEVRVARGEAELRATLVFADPPGVPGAAVHRVNDLSLKVTSPSGASYWGNNGLNAAMTSAPGGEPNHVDTVEAVILANPEAGVWTIEVRADEINEDGHVETEAIDADFALVVSGVSDADDALNSAPSIAFDVVDPEVFRVYAVDLEGEVAKVVFNVDGEISEDFEAPFELERATLSKDPRVITAVAFDTLGASSEAAHYRVP